MKRPVGPISNRERALVVALHNLVLTLWWGGPYKPVRLRKALVARGGLAIVERDAVEVVSMPRMPSGQVQQVSLANRAKTKVFGEKFPELASWLTDAAYPDGKPIGLVQFSIRPKGAVYVAQLRVQDHGGLVLTVEDANLDDALLLLEASLTADPIPWTRDPYPLGTVTGKKK